MTFFGGGVYKTDTDWKTRDLFTAMIKTRYIQMREKSPSMVTIVLLFVLRALSIFYFCVYLLCVSNVFCTEEEYCYSAFFHGHWSLKAVY